MVPTTPTIITTTKKVFIHKPEIKRKRLEFT